MQPILARKYYKMLNLGYYQYLNLKTVKRTIKDLMKKEILMIILKQIKIHF